MKQRYRKPLFSGSLGVGALVASALLGCGDSTDEPSVDADLGSDLEGLDTSHFLPEALVSDIDLVDCTLSDGTETSCYRLEIKGAPSDHEIGPFCPRSITDGADVAGIWLEGGEVFDVTGAWLSELAQFYSDDNWQLYDVSTGLVHVTDTQEACEAAARPDVAEEYQNHCVECSIEYYGGGISKEYLIPVQPKAGASVTEIGAAVSVGVAFNGAHFDPPAPVNAILSAYTIAAFDDCGGHVNPATGYHYHAETGCTERVAQDDGHAALIGYALDGYAMHAMTGDDGVEADDLDSCRGHSDGTRGYHYHSAGPGENMFIGCFHGLVVGSDDGGGGGGGEVMSCDDVADGSPCCGDTVCDGPETASNCADDCS